MDCKFNIILSYTFQFLSEQYLLIYQINLK